MTTAIPARGGNKQRLPPQVAPTHYELAIYTDLAADPPAFAGEVAISLRADSDVTEISFNLDPALQLTHLALAPGAGPAAAVALDLAAVSADTEWQVATVDLGATPVGGLKKGDATLFLRWHAPLGTNMNGYYKSVGTPDDQGSRPVYALTQFEPTSARRALPCWDEPGIKATFGVSMIARAGETVLSNMSTASSSPWKPAPETVTVPLGSSAWQLGAAFPAPAAGENWILTKFEPTPKMSTYLLAFACGSFQHLESAHTSALSGRTIPLRVYATSDIAQAQLGLDVMRWALPIYEELFEIAYPLPKLDTLVAHDFDMGAMENWGLITGRTTAYFCNERSSLAARKRIGQVQCHEVAHMWFGNIVTMKWWDNLWLNEAFATLMGSIVLPDRIWPEWKMGTEFINDHWARALALDGSRSSHPIEVECRNASEINEIFDAISYSKGASVLRMLRSVVGDAKFFKGVALYLKKHVYGNAETKDLWAGISEAVGPQLDVGKVMANWTLKIGFPVITVEEGPGGDIKLTQNRFLSTGDIQPHEDETLWWVPLEIKTVAEDGNATVDHDAVLDQRSASYPVGSDTFKLNAETVGVYRVAYSAERLDKLGRQGPLFSVEDRVGIVSDAAALAAAGYSKTSGALGLARALAATETQYLPFAGIAALVGSIADVWWENDGLRTAVDRLRVQLFLPVVQRMGFDHGADDAPEVKQLRALAVAVTSAAREPTVVAELQRRFARFMQTGDDSGIAPELQATTFKAAVRSGGAAEYDKVLALYTSPPNPSTKVDAMQALGAAQDPALLDRSFAMLADPALVKDQDLFFTALAANRTARRRTAEYFMSNWGKLNERFSASFGLRNAIAGVLGSLSSRADLERVQAFVASNDTQKYKSIIAQAVDKLTGKAKWLERDEDDIVQWLQANQATSAL